MSEVEETEDLEVSKASWEKLETVYQSLSDYSSVKPHDVNKEHTLQIRRGFHSVAQLLESFIEKEREYLTFLAKRASFSPRCYFVKAHQMEVDTDMVQLHKLKTRMTACRDKCFVVGQEANIKDLHIQNLYMPSTEEPIDSFEMCMALYGNM